MVRVLVFSPRKSENQSTSLCRRVRECELDDKRDSWLWSRGDISLGGASSGLVCRDEVDRRLENGLENGLGNGLLKKVVPDLREDRLLPFGEDGALEVAAERRRAHAMRFRFLKDQGLVLPVIASAAGGGGCMSVEAGAKELRRFQVIGTGGDGCGEGVGVVIG